MVMDLHIHNKTRTQNGDTYDLGSVWGKFLYTSFGASKRLGFPNKPKKTYPKATQTLSEFRQAPNNNKKIRL